MNRIDTGERVAVLDLGKTNIKVLVADENGAPVEVLSYPNAPDASGPYLAIDLKRIEALVIDALADLNKRHNIRAIVGTAHGCGGVLVDDHGPVLPAMDYEATPPEWLADAYSKVGPSYAEVFCSISGGAMRPAQGLLWQEREFPDAFSRARHFLLTPQYFAFRFGETRHRNFLTGCAMPSLESAQKRIFKYCEKQKLVTSISRICTRRRRRRTSLAGACKAYRSRT